MYCQKCGARLAQPLSYCNHCGADLSTLKVRDQAGTTGTAIDTLLWVIVGTTITLLGMALGALVLIKNGAINERLGIAFVRMARASGDKVLLFTNQAGLNKSLDHSFVAS